MVRQLITFQIAEKLFGIDIMAIREIRAWTPTTHIPHAPPYVHGVVNLRGTVLPVIDLSLRLGWDKTEPTQRHVIIVLQIGERLQGMIVDCVNDIATIEEDSIQPRPEFSSAEEQHYIEGLITLEERMAIILDLRSMEINSGQTGHVAEAA